MSGKVLFACSKCFSRHPFEDLSSGTQLCKACRGSSTFSSVVKCSYCRSEFQATSKSQSVCKKCEHNLGKYGKPSACECCKIVAAFGGSKCMRCASYEARYGPPGQCDECKLRSAFDRREENKKINGKLLCWLCTCAYKRAWLKAQQEGRIPTKKRPHEKTHRDSSSSGPVKKSSRSGSEVTKSSSGSTNLTATTASTAGLDLPEKISRVVTANSGNGMGTLAAPAVITIDPNSADHVVALTTLKERIVSLERRLTFKDKELLEKDKLLTELKGKNFEKEIEMRNKLRDIDRLNEMKVENLNRKITTLLKEVAGLKKTIKKNGPAGGSSGVASAVAVAAAKEKRERDNRSPKDELSNVALEICDKDERKSEDGDVKSEEEDRKSEEVARKSDEDSRDSAVSAKEEPKEENLKEDKKEEVKDKIDVTEEKDNEEAKEEEEDENKPTPEKSRSRSRSRTRSRSGTNSHSPSRSRSRSRSHSKSPSKSHSRSPSRSQSRSRSGSRSHSGSRSRSPSRSRSNSAESN